MEGAQRGGRSHTRTDVVEPPVSIAVRLVVWALHGGSVACIDCQDSCKAQQISAATCLDPSLAPPARRGRPVAAKTGRREFIERHIDATRPVTQPLCPDVVMHIDSCPWTPVRRGAGGGCWRAALAGTSTRAECHIGIRSPHGINIHVSKPARIDIRPRPVANRRLFLLSPPSPPTNTWRRWMTTSEQQPLAGRVCRVLHAGDRTPSNRRPPRSTRAAAVRCRAIQQRRHGCCIQFGRSTASGAERSARRRWAHCCPPVKPGIPSSATGGHCHPSASLYSPALPPRAAW